MAIRRGFCDFHQQASWLAGLSGQALRWGPPVAMPQPITNGVIFTSVIIKPYSNGKITTYVSSSTVIRLVGHLWSI